MSQTRRFMLLVGFSIAIATCFIVQLLAGESFPFLYVNETTIRLDGSAGLGSEKWVDLHGGNDGWILRKSTLSPLVAWTDPSSCIRLVVFSTENSAAQVAIHAPGWDVRGTLVRSSTFQATGTQETEWIFGSLPKGWEEENLEFRLTPQDGHAQGVLVVPLHRRRNSRWGWAIRT